ncbi:MAG: GNAT family N-acetyltransferase [Thermoplasmata archaeon]|nr:GNAT family N-acetyltransferase [Thermoplasmata archaeon]
MAMEFRMVSPEEAESMSDYIHPIWVDTYAPIIPGGRERAEIIFDDWVGPAKVRRDMAAGHFFAYIIIDGRKAGLISAGKEGDDLVISKLYVAPDFRHRHIAMESLDYLADYGRSKGCVRAILEVNPNNAAAVSLYERYGFKKVGENQYQYGPTSVMAYELR